MKFGFAEKESFINRRIASARHHFAFYWHKNFSKQKLHRMDGLTNQSIRTARKKAILKRIRIIDTMLRNIVLARGPTSQQVLYCARALYAAKTSARKPPKITPGRKTNHPTPEAPEIQRMLERFGAPKSLAQFSSKLPNYQDPAAILDLERKRKK